VGRQDSFRALLHGIFFQLAVAEIARCRRTLFKAENSRLCGAVSTCERRADGAPGHRCKRPARPSQVRPVAFPPIGLLIRLSLPQGRLPEIRPIDVTEIPHGPVIPPYVFGERDVEIYSKFRYAVLKKPSV